jgi:hypothetical protein
MLLKERKEENETKKRQTEGRKQKIKERMRGKVEGEFRNSK